jgi:hypothetical protein
MSTAAQARFDATISRLDSVLDRSMRRVEAVEARIDAEREDARRQRMRDNAEARRLIAQTYDDSFRSFGVTTPEAADDESPTAYRRRLFNRLARKLAPDHELSSMRADDLGGQAIVFDNFEQQLLEAARQEGLRPSIDNLPPSGEMIARQRVDDMGAKTTEYFGRKSFIKSMGREGRRVKCIRDPRSGQAIWGTGLPQAR